MNWEAIGAIGQVLSAAALLFVLVQVRQARQDARRALSQGRAEAVRNIYGLQSDERTIGITAKASVALGGGARGPFVTALMEQAGLTFEEALRMVWVLSALWDYQVQTIPNVDDLPPMERAQFNNGIRLYGQPGVYQLFFETRIKQTAHPDAVRYVEEVLARQG